MLLAFGFGISLSAATGFPARIFVLKGWFIPNTLYSIMTVRTTTSCRFALSLSVNPVSSFPEVALASRAGFRHKSILLFMIPNFIVVAGRPVDVRFLLWVSTTRV